MKIVLISFLLFFSVTLVQGQGQQGYQFLINFDNDMFGISNKDENYTGGLKFELLLPGFKTKWLPHYRFKGEKVLNIQRFSFGGTGYTPQDLKSDDVVVGDRPYASSTYISFGTISYNLESKWFLSSEIFVGAIGAPGPGNAQAYMHANHWGGTTRDVPNGWHNQIAYDGSFMLNYNVRAQGLIGPRKSAKNPDFRLAEINWVTKVDVGSYMINVQGGFKFNLFNYRVGYLTEYNPDLPTIMSTEYVTAHSIRKRWLRINMFVEPMFRIAPYNATLEGLMFNDNSVYKIEHKDVNRFLFEITGGVNLLIGNVVYLRYSVSGRSQEFSGGKSFHSWGCVTFGISAPKWHRESLDINVSK